MNNLHNIAMAGELCLQEAILTALATKRRAEEQVIPLVQAFGERFNNPFAGEVDFDHLFACQTTDCLPDEILKD